MYLVLVDLQLLYNLLQLFKETETQVAVSEVEPRTIA